jgi:nicotinate-nucleotide pyrophosphorylase (carboxylating)
VESLDELRQAIDAGADIAMLDDFALEDMVRAVAINRAAAHPSKIEASGGVTLQSIRGIAATGVDYISVGAITKHVRAVDLSMRFEWSR